MTGTIDGTLGNLSRSERMHMIHIVTANLGPEARTAVNKTAFHLEREGKLEIHRASSSSNSAETRVEKEATQEDEERWEKVETKRRGKGKADEPRKATEIDRVTATGSSTVVEQAV